MSSPVEEHSPFSAVVASGTSHPRLGKVAAYDRERGLGSVVALDGAVFGFHSTAISDGLPTDRRGRAVAFSIAAGAGRALRGDRVDAARVNLVTRLRSFGAEELRPDDCPRRERQSRRTKDSQWLVRPGRPVREAEEPTTYRSSRPVV